MGSHSASARARLSFSMTASPLSESVYSERETRNMSAPTAACIEDLISALRKSVPELSNFIKSDVLCHKEVS